MEWEKSDTASILVGTVVQYEEVIAVQDWVWLSLEEAPAPECLLSASTYARDAAAQGTMKFFAWDSTSCVIQKN